MTARWREKEHWLINTAHIHASRKEQWDGSHFTELSWFWDPQSEWTLPVLCPFCNAVICATIVDDIASQECYTNMFLCFVRRFVWYIAGERNPAATNYYYGNFRYHVHYPWSERVLESVFGFISSDSWLLFFTYFLHFFLMMILLDCLFYTI